MGRDFSPSVDGPPGRILPAATTMETRRRLIRALIALAAVFMVGVVGFVLFGDHVSWLDAIYMVVVSLTGVGYGEIVSTEHHPLLRAFNLVVLVTGVGIMVIVFSLATAFVVEGDLTQLVRRRKMQRRIAGMSGHYVVCGAGATGTHVIQEIGATGGRVVAVDLRADRLAALGDVPWLATIEGDATDADILDQAGLDRAKGLVAALPSEKDNLVITVTARQNHPALRIVSRHVADPMGERLKKAGADATVNPTFIGGMRLASEMARPHVVGFLDLMLREKSRTLRIEEIEVPAHSSWSGLGLGKIGLRKEFGLTCLALRPSVEGEFRFGPDDADIIPGESIVIVMGDVERIVAARAAAAATRRS